MAQYGTFTYADTTLYGSSAIAKATQTWIVNVDWNGDGSYDGNNDGAWLINCNIKRGREEYLNASGAGFEHMRVGTATLTFDNSTQRYDPRYAAGPLYGYLKPGRKMQISVKDNSDDTNYVVFTGLIDDIVPTGHAKETVIKCVDYLQWLVDQELTFTSELLNTTISGALNHLLTQAQYPGGRNITGAANIDNQPIWVFGVNKETAGSVIHAIADAGLGTFYIDYYGNAVYKRRNHSTSAVNFNDSLVRTDIQVSQPWDGVYNNVTVERVRYIKQQPSIIFTLPEAIAIANGGSEVVEINYDPSTDIQLREIVANTQSNGEGTALTFTGSSPSFGYTGGVITINNNTGSNGYLTDIVIRGRKYVDTIQKYTDSDATSQSTYGIRRFQLKTPFLQDGGYASAFATILKNFLKDDRESLIIKLRGYPTYRQYYFDIGNLINFTSTSLGISAQKYTILGIDHDWMNDNGQDVLTTFYLHKVLVNSDTITPSSLETAPPVPEAPPGYDEPGGDPDTIASDPTLTANQNGYMARVVPSNFGIINAIGDLSDGEYVKFSSALQSSDIVGSILRNSTDILMPPGAYLMSVMGEMHFAGTTDIAYNFTINVKVFNSGGTLLDTYTQQAGSLFYTNDTSSFLIEGSLPLSQTVLVSDPAMSYVRISLDGSSTPDWGGNPYVFYNIRNVFLYRISTTPTNLQ